MAPVPLLELKHADPAVGAGACEQTAGFVRRPGDYIYRGGVVCEFSNATPAARGLIAPDEDPGIIGGGGEDVAVFGVGLGGGVSEGGAGVEN